MREAHRQPCSLLPAPWYQGEYSGMCGSSVSVVCGSHSQTRPRCKLLTLTSNLKFKTWDQRSSKHYFPLVNFAP